MYEIISTAKKIKEARLSRGMTQEEISRLIEMSAEHYKNIELGKVIPKINTLLAISAATDHPLLFFVPLYQRPLTCVH